MAVAGMNRVPLEPPQSTAPTRLTGWLKRRLTHDRFMRSILTRVSGSTLSLVVAMASTPILTRLYSPTDFGVLAVYVAFVATIGVVASLSYQLAIPLPHEDDDAAYLVLLSFCFALAFSAVSSVAVVLFAEPVAERLGIPAVADHLWMLPLGVLAFSGCHVLYKTAVRRHAFAFISRSIVIQSAATAATKIGASAVGPFGLIAGHFVGQLVGVLFMGRLAVNLLRRSFTNMRWAEMVRLGRRYWRFPAFASSAAIVTKLAERIPPIVFMALFGPAAAGLYELARRVCLLPMVLGGHAVSDVLGSQVGKAHRAGTLGPLVYRVYCLLVAGAIPPLIILIASGPELFSVVFGERWRVAGEFARWLTPLMLFQVVNSPLHYCFAVLQRQALYAVYQAAALTTLIIGLLVGSFLGDPHLAVGAASILAGACYLAATLRLFMMTRLTLVQALVPILHQGLIGVLLALPTIATAVADQRVSVRLGGLGVTLGLTILRYVHLFRAREGVVSGARRLRGCDPVLWIRSMKRPPSR